jgi:hypothetical protein
MPRDDPRQPRGAQAFPTASLGGNILEVHVHAEGRRWRTLVLAAGAVALLAAGVALAVGYGVRSARQPGFLSLGVAECRRAYGRAASRTDSLVVDARHPAPGPQKDPNAPSCGVLRRTGALQ